MSQGKAEALVARLLSNAAGLQYGSVSVTAKVHNGRVVEVVYSTTESTRETEVKESGAILNALRRKTGRVCEA